MENDWSEGEKLCKKGQLGENFKEAVVQAEHQTLGNLSETKAAKRFPFPRVKRQQTWSLGSCVHSRALCSGLK